MVSPKYYYFHHDGSVPLVCCHISVNDRSHDNDFKRATLNIDTVNTSLALKIKIILYATHDENGLKCQVTCARLYKTVREAA